MKIIILFAAILLTGFTCQAQNVAKKLPPMKELPEVGEKKVFYELDAEYDYKIYDIKGSLIEEDHEQFIDITKFEPGEYFIFYNGKKEVFKRIKD